MEKDGAMVNRSCAASCHTAPGCLGAEYIPSTLGLHTDSLAFAFAPRQLHVESFLKSLNRKAYKPYEFIECNMHAQSSVPLNVS